MRHQTAKIFINGRSQAVRLPAEFRFDTQEVFIRKDPESGDIILSRKPANWEGFLAALKDVQVPADFLDKKERVAGQNTKDTDRDPFEGWEE